MTNTATASTLVRVAGIGVPVIYFCHGLHWNGQCLVDLPFRVIELSLLSRTDAIVFINSAAEDWFTRSRRYGTATTAQIGRAHVGTPVMLPARMPSTA